VWRFLGTDPPDDVRVVLEWFEQKSLPTSALADRMVVRRALDGLKRKLDGMVGGWWRSSGACTTPPHGPPKWSG
jgi:hypothetical protein